MASLRCLWAVVAIATCWAVHGRVFFEDLSDERSGEVGFRVSFEDDGDDSVMVSSTDSDAAPSFMPDTNMVTHLNRLADNLLSVLAIEPEPMMMDADPYYMASPFEDAGDDSWIEMDASDADWGYDYGAAAFQRCEEVPDIGVVCESIDADAWDFAGDDVDEAYADDLGARAVPLARVARSSSGAQPVDTGFRTLQPAQWGVQWPRLEPEEPSSHHTCGHCKSVACRAFVACLVAGVFVAVASASFSYFLSRRAAPHDDEEDKDMGYEALPGEEKVQQASDLLKVEDAREESERIKSVMIKL